MTFIPLSQVELERAYRIRFSLTTPDEEIARYWVGCYDASPRRSVASTGFKRRRPTPCDEEEG
jgi:hypothetical protein